MKRFLFKIGLYAVVLFLILNSIAFLSLFFLGKSYFYKPQFVKNGVKETSFDYAVLGSSTGLTTLDTKLIDSLTNKKGLNISMDDSSLSSHYLMLEYFYAIGKKTDCLILAVTPWDLENENPQLNNNDYRFLPYVQEDCVSNYYKNIETGIFKKLSLSKYFPLVGVSYYNTELFYPSLVSIASPKKRNQFDDKGNYCYPNLGKPNEKKHEILNMEFKNPYFQKIKKFCEVKNIKLLLYQSPIYATSVTTKNIEETIINHSNLIQSPDLFYDNIHVNKKGREFCSKKMAAILINL